MDCVCIIIARKRFSSAWGRVGGTVISLVTILHYHCSFDLRTLLLCGRFSEQSLIGVWHLLGWCFLDLCSMYRKHWQRCAVTISICRFDTFMPLWRLALFCVLCAASAARLTQAFSERDALLSLFVLTNGAQWTRRENWNTSQSICDWQGVTCTAGFVTELMLSSNNLQGVIPAQLQHLQQLRKL